MKNEIHNQLIASVDPKYLELTLLPTEQCNFRCTYCYEDFSIGRMSKKTIDSIKNFLNNRISTLTQLNLQWFGGEPLAAKSIMYEISDFAQKLCIKHKVIFRGSITTNGYLMDMTTVRRLHELSQCSYQISLDGLGPVHNVTRRLASGGGTFDRILENLKAIRDSELSFSVLLRIHLSVDNHESLKDLVKMLRSEFLHDSRFSVFLKPIENLGGPHSKKIRSLNDQDRRSLKNDLEHLLRMDNSERAKSLNNNPQICYASRPNSLVIRADGRVQKCTVLLSDMRNTVGNLTPEGKINLDHSLMGDWMQGYSTGDFKALSCPAIAITQAKASKTIPIIRIS